MIGYPKRLIEVDLPIKRISAHARREKSIRHGHISTLHIWWARRPLAACRAVLCAALWLDPADANCPPAFREIAREQILKFADKLVSGGSLHRTSSSSIFGRMNTLVKRNPTLDITNPQDLKELREALLDFIADFSNWDNSTEPVYLEVAHMLTQAAHEAIDGMPGTRPLVVDPFAGGGAIPLEALRIGADAFASDLNPVAVLINKVVLEYIPRYGQRLADEVRKWGDWIKKQAEDELKDFYPKDKDGSTPIAYLWARTIICEGPNCGCEVPLMRSFWLAKKDNKSVALRLIGKYEQKRIDFEIIHEAKGREFDGGTVRRGSASCPCCGYTTPVERVRAQLKARRGGAADARLLAVVTTHNDVQGRFYRLPNEYDLDIVQAASAELEHRKSAHTGKLSLIPDELFPPTGLRRVQVPNYGIEIVGDMFTPRQALAISTIARFINQIKTEIEPELAKPVITCLSLLLDKQIDLGNSLNRWEPVAQCPRQLFARQSVPIVWDFAEGVPIGASSGSWSVLLDTNVKLLAAHANQWSVGQAENASALNHPLADDSVSMLVTDPPYYDSVVYAHTTDVFYPWLRRQLSNEYPELFSTELTPKAEEIVVDPPHSSSPSKKDAAFFEEKMTEALAEGRRFTSPGGLGVIVFAHQSTSGWEAMLNALLKAGWAVSASWPIDTEMASRVIAQNKAVLASSIHLVCRPRETADGMLINDVGDWRDVLGEMPDRIREWLPRLEREGVVGADAIFSCLGPAMEIYSRYARVEKASGEIVALREYLEQVWAVVSREALNLVFAGADTSDFEEDARLTVIWFWSLKTDTNGNGNDQPKPEIIEDELNDEDEETEEQPSGKKSTARYSMEYDTARKIAQGLGADLRILSRPGGIVTIKGNLASLNQVTAREERLIGVQLSLFGDEIASPKLKTKRHQNPSVVMRTVSERKLPGFEDPSDESLKSDQALLPMFGQYFEDERTFIQRLLDGGITVLDRLHQAMLIHGRGQTALLSTFLIETGMGSDVRFWRLADVLLRLYPKHTEEYRWLDGVLARKKTLGY